LSIISFNVWINRPVGTIKQFKLSAVYATATDAIGCTSDPARLRDATCVWWLASPLDAVRLRDEARQTGNVPRCAEEPGIALTSVLDDEQLAEIRIILAETKKKSGRDQSPAEPAMKFLIRAFEIVSIMLPLRSAGIPTWLAGDERIGEVDHEDWDVYS
jgi:hypothetical protein